MVELLEGVRKLGTLTGESVAAEFEGQGWEAAGRPKNGFETSWRKNGVLGWIHRYSGGFRVEFTVWMRDVDEDTGYFEDLEAVYAEGEQVLARFLPEIESSVFSAHLTDVEGTAEDADEYIAFRKWTLHGRTLAAGVVQEDTDLPVRAVVVLEEQP